MLLKTVLVDFCREFDVFLLGFLDDKIKLAGQINPSAARNLEEIKKLIINGGKRIRPFLVFLGFSLFGQINEENKLEIFKIGTSLELFHTFALIHDDIIDDSLTRRGKPTIEQNYLDFFDNLETVELGKSEAKTKKENVKNITKENNHNFKTNLNFNYNNLSDNLENNIKKYSKKTRKLASSAAILAGDYAHTLADSLINSVNERVREIYYQMQFELVAGQIDDCFGISLESLDKITRENVLNMLICKSGNYSIQKPLLMGINLALGDFDNNFGDNLKQNKKQTQNTIFNKNLQKIQSEIGQNKIDEQNTDENIENLQTEKLEVGKILELAGEIGQDLGLVFQLVDDILGVFGEDSVTGKSVVSDLESGKKTLLVVETWANSTDTEKQIILANLGNKNGDFEILRNLIKQKGLNPVQKMVDEISQKSVENTKKLQRMEQNWQSKKLNLETEQINFQNQENQIENRENSNQNWQILLELIDYLKNRKS